MSELHTEQDMCDERTPVGPKRYFCDGVEISKETFDALVAERHQQINTGHCGIVD